MDYLIYLCNDFSFPGSRLFKHAFLGEIVVHSNKLPVNVSAQDTHVYRLDNEENMMIVLQLPL